MALIRQILKPERFNSAELVSRIFKNLGWGTPDEHNQRVLIDAVQFTLDGLVAEGILSTEVKTPGGDT